MVVVRRGLAVSTAEGAGGVSSSVSSFAVVTAGGVWACAVCCYGLFCTIGAASAVVLCVVCGVAYATAGLRLATFVGVSKCLAPGALGEGWAWMSVLDTEPFSKQPDGGFVQEAFCDVSLGVFKG